MSRRSTSPNTCATQSTNTRSLALRCRIRRIHDVERMLRARPVFQNGNETAAVDMGLREKTEGLADAQTGKKDTQMRGAFVDCCHSAHVNQ